MDKTYQPSEIEQPIYQRWLNSDVFQAKPGTDTAPFCIMLPPPNVTGNLHMGHAFQQTLIDILIRVHRMQGHETLWQVGVDHAGIATQMVVENQLFQEGKSRYDLGRERFVKKVWDWKELSGGAIMQQMRRLGASADWSRERFTMDAGLSETVQTAFIQLYEAGLIYRGKRLVNWDPYFKTAVSDLEVIHTEEQGFLHFIAYPLGGSSTEQLMIATTRPETMLGDTAVAVHPNDIRYQHLIGKTLRLPLSDREIPIIGDDYVDPAFGTGCVKITPAHDFNDYEIGLRHNLPLINILTEEGKINENAPSRYQGLDRFEARKKILQDLTAEGLLVEKKPHILQVPRNERGNTILEPFLTAQWYVKMQPLAAPALDAVKAGKVQFVPEEWQNTYFRWLENIQDWCISRQLWWGHRIPAWYDETGQIYIGKDEGDVRQKYHLDESLRLKQDEDVLDTWFSSALWPFSTLGWPQSTPDFAKFYPTSVLVTGFDIIFFWVARMIMFGLYFTAEVPFKTVYIHGLIRDQEGHKMSKSKGNGLDPIDLIDGINLPDLIQKRLTGLMQESLKPKVMKATEKQFPQGIQAFGTDALRFTFAAIAAPTRDINFNVKRLEGYRNFCNKLWNAARFVMMNLTELDVKPENFDQGDVIRSARGDLSACENIHQYYQIKFNHTIKSVHEALALYRFDSMAQTLYEFFWNDYCDWYLEFCKIILQDISFDKEAKSHARHALLSMLEQILRLLHPIIPFITEEIWQTLKKPLGINAASIINQPYPVPEAVSALTSNWNFTEWLQTLVIEIRKVRAEKNIHPSQLLPLYFDPEPPFDLTAILLYLKPLAKVDRLSQMEEREFSHAQGFFVAGEQFYLGNVIDPAVEKIRLQKEIAKINDEIEKIQIKLSNPDFMTQAPPHVVMQNRQRFTDYEVKKALLEKDLQFIEV